MILAKKLLYETVSTCRSVDLQMHSYSLKTIVSKCLFSSEQQLNNLLKKDVVQMGFDLEVGKLRRYQGFLYRDIKLWVWSVLGFGCYGLWCFYFFISYMVWGSWEIFFFLGMGEAQKLLIFFSLFCPLLAINGLVF